MRQCHLNVAGAICERDQLTFPEALARHVEIDGLRALRASSSDEKSVLIGYWPPRWAEVVVFQKAA